MNKQLVTSPRINSSDYDGGRDKSKLWGKESRTKNRDSVTRRNIIFNDDEKKPPTFCGFPRWACLMIAFILFGAFSGVIAWLVVKNQRYLLENPEFKKQFDAFKSRMDVERKKNMLEGTAQALINKTGAIVNQHSRAKLHYYVQV